MNIKQVYEIFPTQADCIAHLEKVRWNGKPVCPYCKSTNTSAAPKESRHHCNTCNTTFSVTVQTIFHKTKVDLQRWFVCISLVLNAKKGIAARQLARDLDVNKDTAWYMAMRIRRAMLQDAGLFKGIVEMDEKYVGGKPRKGTISNPDVTGTHNKRGRGTKKIPVVGMIERGGNVKAKVMVKITADKLARMVRENVDPETVRVFTDEFGAYCKLAGFVKHESVNHKIEYVRGDVHTNTMEGFWALLQRGVTGQYHQVSLRYLPKYVDEFCYRHNNRANSAAFDLTISRALGVQA